MSNMRPATSLVIGITLIGAILSTNAQAEENPAHALAEKFSSASEQDARKQRNADEADLLMRARKEAAKHRKENEASLKAAAAAEEARKSREAKRKQQVQELRAQLEEDRKRLSDKIREVNEAAAKEATRKSEAAELAKLEAEREKTAQQLEEKLRQLSETRKSAAREKIRQAAPRMSLGGERVAREENEAPKARPYKVKKATARGNRTDRVTILLTLTRNPAGTPRHARHHGKKPDPVICSSHACWISRGAATPARQTTRAGALGPVNTISRRAAACNRSLTCVYRNVRIASGKATIQPIDIGVFGHKRGQLVEIEPDQSCHLSAGKLDCQITYKGDNWRAWVVPEHIAEEVGADGLREALTSGLNPQRQASLFDIN